MPSPIDPKDYPLLLDCVRSGQAEIADVIRDEGFAAYWRAAILSAPPRAFPSADGRSPCPPAF
jgi:hypothetical protein